jgi:hypothetical protein
MFYNQRPNNFTIQYTKHKNSSFRQRHSGHVPGTLPHRRPKTIQTTLQIIEDWCKEHKLEISKDKSALMPMFIRIREEFKSRPIIAAWGLKIATKMR